GLDTGQTRPIVQGRQRFELMNGRDDRVVEHRGRSKLRAAVHDAVSRRLDAQAGRAEPLCDPANALGVIAHRGGRLQRRTALGFERKLRLVRAQPLDAAVREPARVALSRGELVEQSELDRRAPTVDREDLHAPPSSFLTMAAPWTSAA